MENYLELISDKYNFYSHVYFNIKKGNILEIKNYYIKL